MGRLKYFFLLTWIGMFLTGCNNWLDVQPQDKMSGEQVYSTEKGLRNALNGLYLQLGTNSLYGANLSCGFLDVLGQLYVIKDGNHVFLKSSEYEYTHNEVKAVTEAIWKNAYKVIVNANLLYNGLSEYEGVLSPEETKLFYGEVFAIRALVHFELFRLFGPVVDETTKEELSIPYYDYYTTSYMPLLPADSIKAKVLRDIDCALVNLQADPVLVNGKGLYKDSFWSYRHFRMNYYAVLALKARVNLHFGQKEEAYRIASQLLEGRDPQTGKEVEFVSQFPFVNIESAISSVNPDRFFYSEMLFCLDNQKRDELHKSFFISDLELTHILMASSDFIQRLFVDENTNDIRFVQLWNTTPGGNKETLFKKFESVSDVNNALRCKIQPVFRLGELYLIAAEAAPDDATRMGWLEKLRLNRRYQVGNASGHEPEELLKNEIIREFYGEGQYFYYMKRRQLERISNQSGTEIEMKGKYRLPLPDSEINNR